MRRLTFLFWSRDLGRTRTHILVPKSWSAKKIAIAAVSVAACVHDRGFVCQGGWER